MTFAASLEQIGTQLDKRFDKVEEQLHLLGVEFEHQKDKLDQVLDIVLHMSEKIDRVTPIVSRYDDHEYRIRGLESFHLDKEK